MSFTSTHLFGPAPAGDPAAVHMESAPASWKRWNRFVISGLVASAALVVGFNYAVDPYEVFHSGFFRPGFSVNERYNKIEFLLTHKDRFDSFIVGSSVMGAYDPRVAQAARPGRRYYNLSFLGGVPSEALDNLKLIKAQGVPVKELVMGIDIFPFVQASDGGGFSQRPHPLITGQSKISYLTGYLFASSAWQGTLKIWYHFQPEPSLVFDIDGTGMYLLKEYERDIARDPDGFTKKHVRRKDAAKPGETSLVWVEKRFAELREMVEWTRREGIETHFFIQPFNHLVRESLPDAIRTDFAHRIAAIAGPDIPNYSLRTDITDDDRNYYDLQHYRPIVARQILTELLGGGARATQER